MRPHCVLLLLTAGCGAEWSPPTRAAAHPQLRLEPLEPDPGWVISGEGLEAPVWVPRWMTEVYDPGSGKETLHDETDFFPLGEGLWYVEQYNSWAGDRACRVFDASTSTFRPPEAGCLEVYGIHRRVERGPGDWLAVWTSFGCSGGLTLTRFHPDRGQHDLLEVGNLGTGGTFELEWAPDGRSVILSTNCPDSVRGITCDWNPTGEGKTRLYTLNDDGELSRL